MTGKNFLPDVLMLLFQDSDRYIKTAAEAETRVEESAPDGGGPVAAGPASEDLVPGGAPRDRALTGLLGYSTDTNTMRARLRLQGFTTERAMELGGRFFDAKLADQEYSISEDWDRVRGGFESGAELMSTLMSPQVRSRVMSSLSRLRASSTEDAFFSSQWESLLECFDDPRFELSLTLCRVRSSTKVDLDLTDLLLGGWVEAAELPHRTARTRLANSVASNGPVIVITEGRSDARWLRRSLALAAPGVADSFQFLDFEGFSAQGGTDKVVSLTRGMAATSVMNRVIAVVDNDGAGREAMQILHRSALPARMRTVALPDVPYAEAYPTLGPTGTATADINGRAATIEFMFGIDVLRDDERNPFPVRWQGWVEAVGQYQGRLDSKHKDVVRARLDAALAVNSFEDLSPEVAEGCRRLADLLTSSAHLVADVPASEYSPLTWGRELAPADPEMRA